MIAHKLKITLAAAAMALVGSAANALTIEFDSYLSGEDLGTGSLATLEANTTGSGVQMTLTNNAVVGGLDTFLTQLFLTYEGGDVSSDITSLTNDGGVAVTSLTLDDAGFVNAGYTWNAMAAWSTSGAGGGAARLNIGESSTFTLVGADIDDLFGGDPFAMLHVQGLDSGGSTKYGGTCTDCDDGGDFDVPLPAGLPLLVTALGGLGLMRRKSRKA